MLELTGDKIPFWEKYHIEKKPGFDSIEIQESDFSVRLYKRLKNDLNVKTLLDLICLSEDDLFNVRGLGRGCIEELIIYVKDIKNQMSSLEEIEPEYAAPILFVENRNKVFEGDFSFCEDVSLSEQDYEYLYGLQEAHSVLDKELLNGLCDNEDYLFVLRNTFYEFAKPLFDAEQRRKHLKDLLNCIQDFKRNILASGLIKAYTSEDYLRELLLQPIAEKNYTLENYINCKSVIEDAMYSKVCAFLAWCKYDLNEQIGEIEGKTFKNERSKEIVELRAAGKTLEEIGKQYSVTRERIRQIEKKAVTKFNVAVNTRNIIMKIYAERNEDDVLTRAELKEYFGDKTNMYLYLLMHSSNISYIYDKDLDVVVVGDGTYTSKVADYIDSLPEEFDCNKLSDYIEIATTEYELPDELVEKAIQEEYKITGSVYHRTKLTLANIYISMIKQFFPDGIRAYEDADVNELRKRISEMYGEVKLPNTNRAVGARIASVCVLCDRGTYIPKREEYISKELLKKIEKYIDDSDNPAFLMNTLFFVFKEDLEKFDIHNKYYLQGVLKELTGDKYIFRKDYLLKEETESGLYDDIVRYIEQFDYPVTKEELKNHYLGVTEIVISLAVADKMILNYFGSYLHASKLKISEEEKIEIESIVNDVMSQQDACHSKDLFPVIYGKMQLMMNRNGIKFGFHLFSVLEFLLSDKYDFHRPYIVKKGASASRPLERVEEYIYSEDVIQLSNLMSYARSVHAAVPSIIELVNTYNEDYLLIDNETLACYNYIGLTRSKIIEINQLIYDEIEETIPIRNLKCINDFPKINVDWNEWLIYGIANQSDMLEVAMTSTQLRQAVPLVSPVGCMKVDKYESVSFNQNSQLYQLDNLDNIDDLLLDIDDDEW